MIGCLMRLPVSDRLFEEAAVRLSLKSLIGFLTELCEFSHEQLSSRSRQMSLGGQQSHTAVRPPPPHTSLLLYRLGDIIARSIANERPHLHLMRVWRVASSHFVEVFSSPLLFLPQFYCPLNHRLLVFSAQRQVLSH